jgi:hypothetical protein
VVKAYKQGEQVTIVCQTEGLEVNGNKIWDKTSDGCFVTDYFVKTGTSKFVAEHCGSSSSSSAASSAAATTSAAPETSSAAVPSTTVVAPTGGSNSTVLPTGSVTSTGGPATSTTPVTAGAAALDLAGLYAALPLALLALF